MAEQADPLMDLEVIQTSKLLCNNKVPQQEALEAFKNHFYVHRFSQKPAYHWAESALMGDHSLTFMFIMSYAKQAEIMSVDQKYQLLVLAVLGGNYYLTTYLIIDHEVPMEIITQGRQESVLVTSVMRKHIAITKFLIERGANVQITNVRRTTLLHKAVINNDVETAALLCEAGIQIDATHASQTALQQAVNSGLPEMVLLLTSQGANPTIVNQLGRNTLHTAVDRQDLDIIKTIVEAGHAYQFSQEEMTRDNWEYPLRRFLNAQDNNGETPLMLAVKRGSPVIVNYLVSKGALAYALNKDGDSVFHLAVARNDPTMYKVLQAHFSRPPGTLSSPLYIACENGQIDLVKAAISGGDDVDKQNTTLRYSALHIAAAKNRWEIIRLLAVAKADLDTKDRHGKTPLHHAVTEGHYESAERLIEYGADPNEPSEHSTTVLTIATRQGRLDMVNLILASPKLNTINSRDNKNYTVLHCAIDEGHTCIVKALLKAGASTTILDGRNRTAVDAAKEGRLQPIIDALNEWLTTNNFAEISPFPVSNEHKRKNPEDLFPLAKKRSSPPISRKPSEVDLIRMSDPTIPMEAEMQREQVSREAEELANRDRENPVTNIQESPDSPEAQNPETPEDTEHQNQPPSPNPAQEPPETPRRSGRRRTHRN